MNLLPNRNGATRLLVRTQLSLSLSPCRIWWLLKEKSFFLLFKRRRRSPGKWLPTTHTAAALKWNRKRNWTFKLLKKGEKNLNSCVKWKVLKGHVTQPLSLWSAVRSVYRETGRVKSSFAVAVTHNAGAATLRPLPYSMMCMRNLLGGGRHHRNDNYSIRRRGSVYVGYVVFRIEPGRV